MKHWRSCTHVEWLRQSLLSALAFFILVGPGFASPGNTIIVGSKNFLENRLLAEMFAQLIETQTTLTVERRLGLAGTQICFQALTTGGIDLYPEYTGTGLVTILGEPPMRDPTAVLNRVRREFRKRWNLWWLAPLGFDNSYALALRRDRAHALNIRTITDLVRVAPTLRAAFGYEFIQRADGLPGLKELYGLQFSEVIGMQQSLKYQATDKGDVDVLDVYTTDGRLAVYDFVVLEDDRQFFPPYDATALVRGATLERHPELGTVLSLLTNALSPTHMRKLNLRTLSTGPTIRWSRSGRRSFQVRPWRVCSSRTWKTCCRRQRRRPPRTSLRRPLPNPKPARGANRASLTPSAIQLTLLGLEESHWHAPRDAPRNAPLGGSRTSETEHQFFCPRPTLR